MPQDALIGLLIVSCLCNLWLGLVVLILISKPSNQAKRTTGIPNPYPPNPYPLFTEKKNFSESTDLSELELEITQKHIKILDEYATMLYGRGDSGHNIRATAVWNAIELLRASLKKDGSGSK